MSINEKDMGAVMARERKKRKAAQQHIRALCAAIERWGREEDGIPDFALDVYEAAKNSVGESAREEE